MNLKDLPTSVTINLDEETAVSYPKNGEFEKTFELELLCFGKKQYLKTWPLRQRFMASTGQVAMNLEKLLSKEAIEAAKDQAPEATEHTVDVDGTRMTCMMGGFDCVAAIEEFKQLAIPGKLIKIDDDVYMNKERWEKLDDMVQEEILMTYLANFIQPCVQ